ncbi:MAG: hypothetical protein L3K18_08170 [Thermoplasmata archaeon]|jgi:hypothetical protein|nr:hypothetical protein [Thermoplasmata archaeon]MCI4357094.1 hypothetical protein [Thermoplasmata archaeon]
MRTYVRMVFHSEGASPLDVLKVMRELGFEESMGMHDFVFKWKDRASLDEVIQLVGKMHARMKGLDVNYEITTIS